MMLIMVKVDKLDPCVALDNIVLTWGISIALEVLQRSESVRRVALERNFQTALELFSFEIENIKVVVFLEAENEQ